jgi:hypothetical protein
MHDFIELHEGRWAGWLKPLYASLCFRLDGTCCTIQNCQLSNFEVFGAVSVLHVKPFCVDIMDSGCDER